MTDTDPTVVWIGLLGPVIARFEDHEREVRGERPQRLLAALALQPGRVVPIDRLASIVWARGDMPPDPRRTLHTYVYRLRRTLGSNEVIEALDGGYRLDGDRVAIDWDLFERAIDSADDQEQTDEEIIAALDDALSLWRGPPVEQFADEDWVQPRVVRLEEQRLRAIIARSTALLRSGHPADSIPQLEESVRVAPYHEALHHILIQALHDAGRSVDALRVFQAYRRRLATELGLEPGDAIVALERRIVSGAGPIDERPLPQLGTYEVRGRIGEGAYATVYRGYQPSLDREVAIKMIRPELANRPSFVRRFETEAQLVASLEHPHIVPLYDYWREPDAAYLVMRHLAGGTLDDVLLAGPMVCDVAIGVIDEVAQALAAAHERGVVHRDVKPANILLDERGRAYLSDFGIALGVDHSPGLIGGSPVWSPPELLRNQPVKPATDVYCLGLVLHNALSGKRPFVDATSRDDLRRRQLNESLPRLHGVVDGVPAWIDDLIAAATAKEVDDRTADANEFLRVLHSHLGHGLSLRPMADRAAVNPFKGLEPFRETDVADFHGRERLVARILEVLDRPGATGRLVAVVGPSGSGKSSVVRAGLIPALRHGAIEGASEWFVATMLPGAQPFRELEVALSRIASSRVGPLADEMQATDGGLGRAISQVLPDDSSEALLVIDQFEELFTLVRSAEERDAFLAGLLVAATDPRSRVRVVVTIRADFWDRPLAHAELARLLESSAVSVGAMTGDELERAIVGPVEDQGLRYEVGLAARISSDVIGQPGALPLLQYTLTELYERREEGVIPTGAYDDMGGVAGALASRAEAVFGELSASDQEMARRVFGRLVSLGEGTHDTRRRVLLEEIAQGEGAPRVIEAFGAARLLSFDRDAGTRGPTVEIAHEALLSAWPRLGQWVADDRDALKTHRLLSNAAAEWERNGRAQDELYRGGRLEAAIELIERDPAALNEREMAFVAASTSHAQAEAARGRRRTRILQSLLATSAVLLVLALIATVIAVDRSRDAAGERDAAEGLAEELADERDAAEGLAVELQVQRDEATQLAEDLTVEALQGQILGLAEAAPSVLATLLAVERHHLDPGPESLDVLGRTLLSQDGWMGTLPGWWIETAPDGTVLTVEDDRILVRDPADLTVVREITFASDPGLGLPVTAPALDPTGGRLALAQSDGFAIVDLETSQIEQVNDLRLPPSGQAVGRALEWTPDGDHLIAVSGAEEIVVVAVDGTEGSPVARVDLGGQPIAPQLELDSDSGTLLVYSETFELWVYDAVDLLGGDLQLLERYGVDDALEAPIERNSKGPFFATPGGVFFVNEGGALRRADLGSERPGAAQLVGPGVLFTTSESGDGELLDLETGDIVEGPWPVPNLTGYVGFQEVIRGDVVALTTLRGHIHLWSRAGGNLLSETLPPMQPIAPAGEGVWVLPNEGIAYSTASENKVWSYADGDADRLSVDFGTPFFRVSSTTRGAVAAATYLDGTIRLFDLSAGGTEFGPTFDLGPGAASLPWHAALSNDLGLLVVSAAQGARVFDATSGELLASFDHGKGSAWGSQLLIEDGLAAVTGGVWGEDKAALVIDLESVELVYEGTYEGDGVIEGISRELGGHLVTLPADATLPISAENQLVATFIDWETGERTWTGAPATNASFSPSLEYVIGTYDRVQFIDFETATPVGPAVLGAANRTGNGALSQLRNGRVHVWNQDPNTWPEIACRAAGRNLTRVEWETHLPAVPYDPSCDQWPIEP